MSTIAFDTLKLAQRLEAAGLPSKQAQEMASALGDTIGDAVVTRDYFDLRLDDIHSIMATKVELTEVKSEVLKWMFGAVGLQTIAILGGVATLLRLIH